jgi:hypothetical protein
MNTTTDNWGKVRLDVSGEEIEKVIITDWTNKGLYNNSSNITMHIFLKNFGSIYLCSSEQTIYVAKHWLNDEEPKVVTVIEAEKVLNPFLIDETQDFLEIPVR